MERSLATEATRLQGEVAAEVHRRLSSVAEDSVAPEATGIGDTPGLLVAAAAYLVEGPREGELRRAVEDLQSLYGPAGFTLRLTGPWAPYSFAASTRSDGTD